MTAPGTVRQQMIDLLGREALTAREISQTLGVREKAVVAHLRHLQKSVAAKGKKLQVLPFGCLACGFVFKERTRYSRPGRCPKCKETHLETPKFRITA
jgi:transcriptional regulator